MRTSSIGKEMVNYAKRDPKRMACTKLEASVEGWGDYLFCCDSRLYIFEIKNSSTKDEESPNQERIRRVINSKKIISFIIETTEDFHTICKIHKIK